MTQADAGGVIGSMEAFYKASDRYQTHLLTHDEAFFAPYRAMCRRHIQAQSSLLDLGCGTGQSSALLVGPFCQTLFFKVRAVKS